MFPVFVPLLKNSFTSKLIFDPELMFKKLIAISLIVIVEPLETIGSIKINLSLNIN